MVKFITIWDYFNIQKRIETYIYLIYNIISWQITIIKNTFYY